MRRMLSLFLVALLCLLSPLPAMAGKSTPPTLIYHGSSALQGSYGHFDDFTIQMTVAGIETDKVSIPAVVTYGPISQDYTVKKNGQFPIKLTAENLNQLLPGTYDVKISSEATKAYGASTGPLGTITVDKSYATVSGEFVHTGDMGNMNSMTASYTLNDTISTADDPLFCFLIIAGVPSASITRQVKGGDTVSFTIPADILNQLGAGTYDLSVSCSGNSMTSAFSGDAGRIVVITPDTPVTYVPPPAASVSNPSTGDEETEDAKKPKKLRLASGKTMTIEEVQELPQVGGMYQLEVPSSTSGSVATIPFEMLQDLSKPLFVQTQYGAYVLSKSLTSNMPEVADTMRATRQRWTDMQADLSMAPAQADDLMKQTVENYGIEMNRNFYSMDYSLTVLGPGSKAIPTPNVFTAPVRRFVSVSEEAVSNPEHWAAFRYEPETQTLHPVAQRVVELVPGQKMVSIESYSNSIYLVTQRDVALADVAADHPAYAYISRAVAKALMATTADDNFEPEAPISRGEFVQMFTNILYMPQAAPHPYADVLSDNIYDAAIGEAKTAGWLELLAPGNEFLPGQPITREETLGILQAILQQHNIALTEASSEEMTKQYSDYLKIKPEYMSALAAIANLNILPEVDDGAFTPSANVTRAEAAEVLIKTLVAVQYLDE